MSLKLQKQEKLFFTVKVKFLPGDQETICTIQNCSNTIYFFVALHVSDVSISGLYPLCWYMPPWYQTTEFTSWPWNCCVEVVWLWQVRANKGVSDAWNLLFPVFGRKWCVLVWKAFKKLLMSLLQNYWQNFNVAHSTEVITN